VCTPAALGRLVERDGVVVGRHFVFVDGLNTERVEAVIADRLRRLDGETWADLRREDRSNRPCGNSRTTRASEPHAHMLR
jgi:hypothetical protein